MRKKGILMYGVLGLMVFASLVILIRGPAYTEKRGVLWTTTFTIEGQEQKFRAFYLSAPAEWFEIAFNVSGGSIKVSPFPAEQFEETLGRFEHHINETKVEVVQPWVFEGNNGTAGCSTGDVNKVWYILFYNEDSYEKEIHVQITKVWKEQNYKGWI